MKTETNIREFDATYIGPLGIGDYLVYELDTSFEEREPLKIREFLVLDGDSVIFGIKIPRPEKNGRPTGPFLVAVRKREPCDIRHFRGFRRVRKFGRSSQIIFMGEVTEEQLNYLRSGDPISINGTLYYLEEWLPTLNDQYYLIVSDV